MSINVLEKTVTINAKKFQISQLMSLDFSRDLPKKKPKWHHEGGWRVSVDETGT